MSSRPAIVDQQKKVQLQHEAYLALLRYFRLAGKSVYDEDVVQVCQELRECFGWGDEKHIEMLKKSKSSEGQGTKGGMERNRGASVAGQSLPDGMGGRMDPSMQQQQQLLQQHQQQQQQQQQQQHLAMMGMTQGLNFGLGGAQFSPHVMGMGMQQGGAMDLFNQPFLQQQQLQFMQSHDMGQDMTGAYFGHM